MPDLPVLQVGPRLLRQAANFAPCSYLVQPTWFLRHSGRNAQTASSARICARSRIFFASSSRAASTADENHSQDACPAHPPLSQRVCRTRTVYTQKGTAVPLSLRSMQRDTATEMLHAKHRQINVMRTEDSWWMTRPPAGRLMMATMETIRRYGEYAGLAVLAIPA
ncbi:hypothetical protein BU16DRAFT_555939 [Lophium mytilinum]|uniref:Uncharacterized protein n=1 Tax=Lophium mytilinum TaxID=390894 RepID=A0A6A6RDE4_9PEZI|nr:hypothetical protein BU16DRAFT_555939 [Lophium mytilinum]